MDKPLPERTAAAVRPREPLWVMAAPTLLVFLWSTGFIGAKWVLPYIEPFTVLAIRFGSAAAIFVAIAVATGAPWPKSWRSALHAAVVGGLLYGCYLTGVFWAISIGTPAWISALVTSLQPLLTAVLAGPLLGERVTVRQWIGFGLGFGGVALVVLRDVGGAAGSATGLIVLVGALLAFSGGTLYQKGFGESNDPRTGQVVQHVAAFALVALLAALFEEQRIAWTAELIYGLVWITVVLSVGMFSLLYFLIKRGAVSKVSSLFFLVPPGGCRRGAPPLRRVPRLGGGRRYGPGRGRRLPCDEIKVTGAG